MNRAHIHQSDWWFSQLKNHRYDRFWEARMREFAGITPIVSDAVGECVTHPYLYLLSL